MALISRFIIFNRINTPCVSAAVTRLYFFQTFTNFNILSKSSLFRYWPKCLFSSTSNKQPNESPVSKPSQTARLKQAIRDYGATIIVFHVAISLASLGICYLAVSNGVDAVALLRQIGFSETVLSNQIAIGGSTFVMSYAVHKLFAPVRIGITLSTAPFIVRYLRRINLLKPPKMKS